MSWVRRNEALKRLGVKPQTLYAYVSRNQIAARPDENDPRASLYSSRDIEALVARRRSGRGRQAIATGALSWGDPVMQTAITTVRDGRLIYRGRDAVDLARSATLEETAALLWQTDWPDDLKACDRTVRGDTGKARALAYLSDRAARDVPSFGRSSSALAAGAPALLHGLCSAVTGQDGIEPCHRRLGDMWDLSAAATDLLRRVLVLVADHELNPSSFAARIAAGTGAPLSACALAGCATLAGPLHGEATARALVYLRRARTVGPETALAEIALRQERIPAVGHALYSGGDPRAAALLEWLDPEPTLKQAISAAHQAAGRMPNIDMALAAICLQLDLPDDAPFLLFTTGRMVGWLAHALEQCETGAPIRPRARYIGE